MCCGLAFLKFYFFLSEEEVTAGLSGGGAVANRQGCRASESG